MKKFIYLLAVFVLNVACEEVIEVEVPTEEPRLIVDALIRVDIDEPYIPVEVKLSLSSNFFNNNTRNENKDIIPEEEKQFYNN